MTPTELPEHARLHGARARPEARRLAVALVAGAVALSTAEGIAAEPTMPRVGFLSPNTAEASAASIAAFRQGLRDHGYVEGSNITVEYRYASRNFAQLPGLARELVAMRVDVLVSQVTEASLAAKGATTTTPIVMIGVGDPVAAGLVASLARPGGNVTGSSAMTNETAGKTLALLKEAHPALTRAGLLWNPDNPTFQRQMVREVQAAARTLAIELRLYSMADLAAIERSFAAMARDGVSGVVVLSDPVVVAHASRIAALATRERLPSVSGLLSYAEAGGLVAYGPDFPALFRDAASQVAQILRGTRPAAMPVTRPSRFELVINASAARAIGIAIPPSLAIRADRVVE